MSDQAQPAISPPSLPKGGGAIQSIGKGWGPVGTSGAASFDIGLPVSAGRGYAPGLGLSYQSTVGNGLFGLGWNINLGCVARRATKGVPTYTDDDVIIGPGGNIWLPERDANGAIKHTEVHDYNGHDLGTTYQVIRHFARVEGAFDLIEHWRLDTVDPGFWLVHGADGSLAIYGKNPGSCSVDPADANHVAEWLLEETMNARGEHILYEYKAEDEVGLPDSYPRSFVAQCYLWRVRYGNFRQHPLLYLWDVDSLSDLQWHFDLLFDYGERSTGLSDAPTYVEQRGWLLRSDPHSSFSYGFELGNLRLCQQVLMFHYFPDELDEAPVLVGRLLLEYSQSDLRYNVLVAAHSQAYDACGVMESRPPVNFAYNEFDIDCAKFTEFEAMPGLNDGQDYQLVDLFGDGLSGVLYRSDKSWLYREPMRADAAADSNRIVYGPWQELPRVPVADSRTPVRQALTDLTGDGRLDWVVAQPGTAGFFTLNPDRSWSTFTAFAAFPSEFFNPQGQMTDLVGGGLSDLALIGPHSVRLYASRRAYGFASEIDVEHDDDDLPLLSDSPHELVAFSDILGSGQQHLIRIRHNELKFWPNLGRGRFGKGQLFATLPFTYADFDAGRVRLADLDGSGAPDLIYIEADRLQIFMNQGGNSFHKPVMRAWPEGVRYDCLCQVSTADLQGLGCSSLILTVPHMSPRHWRFDFPQIKPYLLAQTNNNMGAVGTVTYRSSAQEWLDEKQVLKAAGAVAVSQLPFALHVVVQQTQQDEITGNTLTQNFQYRQGYYDGLDRIFRGFGLLLQTDTEPSGRLDEAFTAPVLTKTWFHTGRYPEPPPTGYNNADPDAVPLGAHLLSQFDSASQTDPLITNADEETLREMMRCLSGSVLRTEVFGFDGNQAQATPYAVQSSRYLVRQLQPINAYQRHAQMLPLALESVSYQYERQADDPLREHTVNLAWDVLGGLTQGVKVNCARRKKPSDLPPTNYDEYQQRWWQASHDDAQRSYYFSEALAQYIHLDRPQSWRLGLPFLLRSNAMLIAAALLPPNGISYEHFIKADGLFAMLPRVLTGLSIQRYISCADGEATFEALADYTETAELDEQALSAYDRVMSRADLIEKLREVGYQLIPSFLPEDGLTLWSVKRGFNTYASAERFYEVSAFKPTRSHGETLVEYDPYHIFMTRITDPAGCATSATYSYHSLQPWRVVDANQNTQEAAYDAFGMLRATSFYGTELGVEVGFSPLENYVPHSASPREAVAAAQEALGDYATACFYDPFSWVQRREPVHSAVLQADRYPGDPEKQIRISLVSVDGFGRTLQTRQLVEDGDAYSVIDGKLELEDNKPKTVPASPRWRVSERVEYNNKGLAVRIYRPYFANSATYIDDQSFREHGYCDRQFYDPLGRPTVTLTAAGWMRRQTYLTWYTIAEDENDTEEEMSAIQAQSRK
ncbi:SpvB/TcaC N-terminal domain-containing protein [Pseudomonas sp. CCI4.2]|uniref:SpvB/TcaC N-terminal domain-containing protein n=1 Tax=Pseudomonas sp. CCI4.2 TaxID=3048620 RepID=UPI002AC98E80|nr:SpvB/TcaC N-terminal domain-containing protein [Pseudomonas sp. CCI4.2]MEB0091111.1 SpvB/TcaC N-terminal domain-containing protein [Pseudomonas sp. CCI4.2]WPX56008.1 SpvB/TcaC N-terminal domain-containing protein [Pseudomonas sp. CCI4.2]